MFFGGCRVFRFSGLEVEALRDVEVWALLLVLGLRLRVRNPKPLKP